MFTFRNFFWNTVINLPEMVSGGSTSIMNLGSSQQHLLRVQRGFALLSLLRAQQQI